MDHDYSDLMGAFGAKPGVVRAEANLFPHLPDHTGYLQAATAETSSRSMMACQVRDRQQAHDLHAYLATFSLKAEGGDTVAAHEQDSVH